MAEKKNEKVDVEGLFKKLQSFESEATKGIDSLMAEKSEIRKTAEQRCALLDEQIDKLNDMYKATTGRYYVNNSKGSKAKPSSGAGAMSKEQALAHLKANKGPQPIIGGAKVLAEEIEAGTVKVTGKARGTKYELVK
jgi:hypothetical protein